MRYIDKDYSDAVVVAYEDELKANQLDKSSLANPNIHPTLKGPDVYDQVKSFVHFNNLKNKMLQDQGGICCYCGQVLVFQKHPPYIVEHVFPKERCRELAGEYENLLLSCRPTDEEEKERKDAHDKDDKFWHCDKLKDNKVLTYTPLQPDCSSHFRFYESGEVEGLDNEAKNDIETLGLNCKYLVNRRKAAIFAVLYDLDGNLLPNDELEKYCAVVMNRKTDNTYPEFCFVLAGVLESYIKK